MHFIPEITKAVVGQDQIAIFATPGFKPAVHVTYKPVESFVPILHNIHSVVEEHVLDPVKIIEYAGKDTFAKINHQIVKYLNTAFEYLLAQIQELVIADAALFQSSRILGPTQRQVRTHFLPKFLR